MKNKKGQTNTTVPTAEELAAHFRQRAIDAEKASADTDSRTWQSYWQQAKKEGIDEE